MSLQRIGSASMWKDMQWQAVKIRSLLRGPKTSPWTVCMSLWIALVLRGGAGGKKVKQRPPKNPADQLILRPVHYAVPFAVHMLATALVGAS